MARGVLKSVFPIKGKVVQNEGIKSVWIFMVQINICAFK